MLLSQKAEMRAGSSRDAKHPAKGSTFSANLQIDIFIAFRRAKLTSQFFDRMGSVIFHQGSFYEFRPLRMVGGAYKGSFRPLLDMPEDTW
jgi:hypothetical protein